MAASSTCEADTNLIMRALTKAQSPSSRTAMLKLNAIANRMEHVFKLEGFK